MGFVFPGKMIKDKNGVTLDVHPLHQHSLDCAACFYALLQDPVSRRALAKLGGLDDLTKIQIVRLCVLAFWHDVGKAATGFAIRSINDSNKPSETGHVEEAFALLRGELGSAFEEAFDLPTISNWFGGDPGSACEFFIAALSHHGRPVRIPSGTATMNQLAQAWMPWNNVEPKDELFRMGLLVRLAYPEAFETTDTAHILPKNPRFQAAFAGLVMLADWLASNTDMFPYAQPEEPRADWAKSRALDLTSRIGWGLDGIKPLVNGNADFQKVFGFAPNPMQAAIAALETPESGSVLDIECDPGSGKTEAGLIRALKLLAAGQASGVYFALPSRTSAVQIHRRIVAAFRNYLGHEAPPVLLAVPGYLRVGDSDGRRLPNFRILWNDGMAGPERWASENPKRFLAAPIVIGTIDQALMSVIRTPHAHMRAAMLARMVIVVDEAHASDERMQTLTSELVRRHLTHNGHSVIMSATFPSVLRRRYLNEPQISLEKAVKLPYPSISMLAGNGKMTHVDSNTLKPMAKERRRRIAIERYGMLRHPDQIAAAAAQAAIDGAKVLVIRNTVSAAIETQRQLELMLDPSRIFNVNGTVPAPHHSRFAPADRKILDEEVEKQFGKSSSRSGKVLVATQTMEQSIDIDCDLLITDLCPMDVLIQRLGRLHRHNRKNRPAGYKKPKAYVIVPETRHVGIFVENPHHGFGQAYADLRIIEATWRELETRTHLVIPMESRELVERTTHPEALSRIAAEIGLRNHSEDIAANMSLAQSEAVAALLDIDHGFADHALNRSLAAEDVRVRLGGLDSIIDLPERPMGPFSVMINRLTIPGWMAKPNPYSPDEGPIMIAEENGAFEFAWGWREERHATIKPVFRYSRHGLEIVGKWHRE